MPTSARAARAAVVLSLVAAFLWALYYPFVLAARSGASPAATIAYPFLFGGLAYSGYAVAGGSAGPFRRLWTSPGAWIRTTFLLGMQLSVLASTYLAGPVDTSLLSLLGDVVLTPLLVTSLWPSHRGQIGSGWFTAGMLLSIAGGTLTIVGGETLGRVRGLSWLVLPTVAITVAVYFLLSAQENERTPSSAVVGQSMASAALVSLPLAFLLPGGFGSLGGVSLPALGLLAATGLTSFFVAPILYFRAIRVAGIVLPPMMMTGIPVFTLLLSGLLLGLGLPFLAVLGIPVAVVGAVLTLRGESGRPDRPPRAAS
jgi:drug/metabolite transporter (DMT)-like permease